MNKVVRIIKDKMVLIPTLGIIKDKNTINSKAADYMPIRYKIKHRKDKNENM